MKQTKAIRILLSVLLSIGFWSLFLLFVYMLTVSEYAVWILMILLGLALVAFTAWTIYEKL